MVICLHSKMQSYSLSLLQTVFVFICLGLGRPTVSCSVLMGCRCSSAPGEVVIQAPEAFIIENVPSPGDCISRARTQQRFWVLKFWTEVSRLLWRARIEALLKNFFSRCSSNRVLWNFRECVFWTISCLERVKEGTEVLLLTTANRGHRRPGQGKDEIYLWRQTTCKMLSPFIAAQAPFKCSVSRKKGGGGDISCQKTRGGTGLTTPGSCGCQEPGIWSENTEDEKITCPQPQLSVLPPGTPLPGKQGPTRHPSTLEIWQKNLQAIFSPCSYTPGSEAIGSWLHHLVLDLAL